MRRALAVFFGVFVSTTFAFAQSDAPTILNHPSNSWIYVGGQMNVIVQEHSEFTAPYSGDHSLRAGAEHALSRLFTLNAGVRVGSGWEIVFNVESAGGKGLSDAPGLAGFTNLDVVRNPTLDAAPYLARLAVRKVFSLSSERLEASPSPLSLSPTLPARRIEVRAGKFGMAGFFDANAVGSDSHLQFTNWTVDNNGAYDYAADTRGYTYGVIVEYDTPAWSLRGAEALMPKVANGIVLDWNVARARAENLELELRPTSPLVVRLLGYVNHANMGRYEEAIRAYQDGRDPVPNVEAHRRQGRVKYGTGANMEYSMAGGARAFARGGWNEGDNESFAEWHASTSISDAMFQRVMSLAQPQ